MLCVSILDEGAALVLCRKSNSIVHGKSSQPLALPVSGWRLTALSYAFQNVTRSVSSVFKGTFLCVCVRPRMLSFVGEVLPIEPYHEVTQATLFYAVNQQVALIHSFGFPGGLRRRVLKLGKYPLARSSLVSVVSRMLVWGPTGQFICVAYTFHVSLC